MTGEKVNKKQLCSPAAEGEGEKVHGGQGCHQRVGWCTRAYPRILESRVLGWAKQQQNFALPAILPFNYSTLNPVDAPAWGPGFFHCAVYINSKNPETGHDFYIRWLINE